MSKKTYVIVMALILSFLASGAASGSEARSSSANSAPEMCPQWNQAEQPRAPETGILAKSDTCLYPTINISASPSHVGYNGHTNVSWGISDAHYCDSWSNPPTNFGIGGQMSGSQSVGPLTQGTTFHIRCTGEGGAVAENYTSVSVDSLPPPPPPPPPSPDPTASISASPTSVASGATTTVTWSCGNSSSAQGSGGSTGWAGSKPLSGSWKSGALSSTATYTITCSGGGKSVSTSVKVTVTSSYACSDKKDNDSDGKVDYPDDPGCSSSTDNDEYDSSSSPPGCSGVVVLYEHPNYTGKCWAYGEGVYSTLGPADDVASSIRVSAGYVATLFSGSNFDGGFFSAGSDSSSSWNWSDVWGDNASSLIAQRTPEALTSHSLETTPQASANGSEAISASGCWKVWDGFSRYSHTGRKVVTYKLVVGKFCANGKVITKLELVDPIISTPPFPWPLSEVHYWKYHPIDFYTEGPNRSSSLLKLQGWIEQCVVKYACFGNYQLSITLRLYGDGRCIAINSTDLWSRDCARTKPDS